MNNTQGNENSFYRFLLGEALPDEQEEMEIRLLEDAELQELIQAAEFDLIDDYIRGNLAASETRSFEQNFLNSPARRHQLAMARVILNAPDRGPKRSLAGGPLKFGRYLSWRHSSAMIVRHRALQIAAGVLLLAGGGLTAWRLVLPWWQVREGLALLNEAYSQGRPIETRLSGFRYAAWEKDRGGDRQPGDYTMRDQATLTLLEVAKAHPGAQRYQALGSSYLLKRQTVEAIDQFNKALALDPLNARIHSDLGAALMESAMSKQQQFELLKEREGPTAAQLSTKIFSDLSLANEHFSLALQRDGRSVEALFNQSLCLERLGLLDRALESWERYLELDSGSAWAGEARQRMAELKRRKEQSSFNGERIFQDFLAAYASGESENIRRSFVLGNQQTGNLITGQLLDQYLELRAGDDQAGAHQRLEMLTTIGEIESEKSGDVYARDLAAFYRTVGPQQASQLSAAHRMIGEAREKIKQSSPGALDLLQQARQLFVRAGSACEAAQADFMIGTVHLRASDYRPAQKIAETLAHNSRERGHLWLLARSFYLKADLNMSQNRAALGIEDSRQALSTLEPTRDRNGLVAILGQLAAGYRFLGAYDESMNYIRQALDRAAGGPIEPAILWTTYRNSADALNTGSRFFTSAAFDRQSLQVAIEMDRPLRISRSYGALSDTYRKLKEYRTAIELAGKALEIGTQLGDSPAGLDIRAHALRRLGDLYREVGRLDEALNAFNEWIRLSDSKRLLPESLDVHRGRLMVYMAKHDYQSAQTELEEALRLFEKNRHAINQDELRVSFFETGQDIYQLGIELSTMLRKDYRETFQYSEQGRARSLLDLMAVSSPMPPSGAAGDRVSQPLALPQITEQIPASAQIVQYSVLRNALHFWVLSSAASSGIVRDLDSDDLRRKVEAYLECIGDPKRDEEANRLARELYRILIEPVEARLDLDKEVFIVAESPLNNFPFGALIDPKTGQYLIEKFTIAAAPSSTVFIQCSKLARQKEAFSAERCLSIGQSVFQQPDLQNSSLPSARMEAEQVAASYEHRSKVLLDRTATEDSVRREIVNAEVIHIATHGRVNELRPQASGLALWRGSDGSLPGGDGVLEAGEICQLKLPRARLVVLSACRTFVGRDYRGEGMVGLARAFIVSGAPIVIASLWNVDSQVTAMMMGRLHHYRTHSRMPTARAMREVQLEMLHQDSPDRRRPWSWAGFIVVGGSARF
ncbi:MAG TPA: CHAT domain-containing protein [Blastocatellia bacterium]|nr:CHAT domain-containing protein [Blastocatellia bacterium]